MLSSKASEADPCRRPALAAADVDIVAPNVGGDRLGATTRNSRTASPRPYAADRNERGESEGIKTSVRGCRRVEEEALAFLWPR